MIKRTFFTLISLMLITLISTGQIKQARKNFQYYDYAELIPVLKKIVDKDKKGKDEATQLLAMSYWYMNDMENAGAWLAKSVQTKDVDPIYYFYHAQSLRNLGQYEEAAAAFLKYDSIAPGDPRAKLYAGFCDEAKGWLDRPDSYEVINVTSLNTEYADFSPWILGDKVFFSSDRIIDRKKDPVYEWTGVNYLKIYQSKKLGVIQETLPLFSAPGMVGGELAKAFHDGVVTFDSLGSTIYFTRTINKRKKRDNDRFFTYMLQIYSSHKENGEWVEPEPFFLNDPDYSIGHPCLSPDGKWLYFVSDMPGGTGGTDIYRCKWENDKWSNPENLGNVINTKYDEMFPYLYNDSTLYFSSEGHPGYGALDIFKSTFKNDVWTIPENPGAKLNSSYDDFGIVFADNGVDGLFSSSRPEGAGKDDIYAFKGLEEPLLMEGYVVECKKKPVFLNGYVRENITGQPIANATLFIWNKELQEIVVAKSNQNGYYEIEVDGDATHVIKALKEGYLSDCATVIVNDDPVTLNDLLLDGYQVNKVFRLDNIYYDLDKWNIRSDAAAELDKLVNIMKENPIVIEIGSHTDSRGSDQYNMTLSQKRAESAVNYMVSEGISVSRLKAKGYGETQLVNSCTNGVKCTDAQHQMNRRTEFKILEILDQPTHLFQAPEDFVAGQAYPYNKFDPEFFDGCDYMELNPENQPSGMATEFCDLPVEGATVFVLDHSTNKVKVLKTDHNGYYSVYVEEAKNYSVKAKKESYMSDCLATSTMGDSCVNRDLVLQKYEVEQVFKLDNIYYDLDKSYIRPDAEPALDELVIIMKENPINIELGSHTDCRGSNEYNLELSQKRAEAAVRYIVLQGVAPTRISAKGYGETDPVNHCVDGVTCTEEEYQVNRRTEFRITGISDTYTNQNGSLDSYIEGESYDRGVFGDGFFGKCGKK